MSKRLRKLDGEDIKQLQSISKVEVGISGFWQIVEAALKEKSPHYELHKCNCGQLFLITKGEVQKAEKDFKSSPQTKCWHRQLGIRSISARDAIVKETLQLASVELKKKNIAKAAQICIGLLPIDSYESFDYAFWQLQLGMSYGEYLDSSSAQKRYKYQQQYLKEVVRLLKKAQKKNKNEAKKLFNYFWDKKKQSIFDESLNNALSKQI